MSGRQVVRVRGSQAKAMKLAQLADAGHGRPPLGFQTSP